MEDERVSPLLKTMAVLMFVFLLAPLIIVVPVSVSGDKYMSFPPASWSLRWYIAIFNDPQILKALYNSLILALVVTVASIAVALPAAYALVRIKLRGTQWLKNFLTAPLLLPTIVLGLAILIVFAHFGLLGTFRAIALGHLVVTLPYALRVLSTALSTLPQTVEEAAATLGATPLMVFRRITLPLMRSGLASTAALCFLVSFDEVVLSLFMTGPQLTTLPVMLYHHVENTADPLVAAISVLLIALPLLVLLIIDRTFGIARSFVR